MYPHAIRHTFCSRCFEAGMQPKVVQSIIGHQHYSTTIDIYTHVSESKYQEEVGKFGKRWNRKKTVVKRQRRNGILTWGRHLGENKGMDCVWRAECIQLRKRELKNEINKRCRVKQIFMTESGIRISIGFTKPKREEIFAKVVALSVKDSGSIRNIPETVGRSFILVLWKLIDY